MNKEQNAARIQCPLCPKSVKVKADGTLARHGHRIYWGSYTGGGHCLATGLNPRAAVEAAVVDLRSAISAEPEGSRQLGSLREALGHREAQLTRMV